MVFKLYFSFFLLDEKETKNQDKTKLLRALSYCKNSKQRNILLQRLLCKNSMQSSIHAVPDPAVLYGLRTFISSFVI